MFANFKNVRNCASLKFTGCKLAEGMGLTSNLLCSADLFKSAPRLLRGCICSADGYEIDLPAAWPVELPEIYVLGRAEPELTIIDEE